MAANRKSPQDRQPPAAEVVAEAKERFDEVEGHELLRPLSKVKGSDQTRLMARLQRMGLLDEDKGDGDEVGFDDLDLDEVADLIVGVLSSTLPVTASNGQPGKAKYTLADGVASRTKARAAELLDKFPLYPGLELN